MGAVLVRRVVMVAALSAALFVGVPADAGMAAPTAMPTPTVSPATNLVDGQTVTVTVPGLPDGTVVGASQCDAAGTTIEDCQLRGIALGTSANGTVQLQLMLDSKIYVGKRDPFLGLRRPLSCKPSATNPTPCVIAVARVTALDDWALAPLAFDPAAPDMQPVVTTTPAAGLVDGQTVALAGHGFHTGVTVGVRQCAELPRCEPRIRSGGVVAADGTMTGLQHRVDAVISTPDDESVDCRAPDRCELNIVVKGLDFDMTEPAAVVVPLDLDPAAPLAPPHTVTASPVDGLVDWQVVDVASSGSLAPNEVVSLWQCPGGATDRSSCVNVQMGHSDASGNLVSSARVRSLVAPPGGGPLVDCRTASHPCQLVVTPSTFASSRQARMDLHFDPSGPPFPLEVTPTTDLDAGDLVAVRTTGLLPGARYTLGLCPPGDSPDCGLRTEVTADSTGALAVDFEVEPEFEVTPERLVDCRTVAGGCTVGLVDPSAYYPFLRSEPLAFVPGPAHPVRYRDRVFDELTVTKDVVYRSTTDYRGLPVELTIDVYQPAGDTAAERPVVFVPRSGGFVILGSVEDELAARYWARRGYVAAVVDYRAGRLDLFTGWPSNPAALEAAAMDAYDDTLVALQWLRDRTAELRIDPDAIAAAGADAGGVTAFNLAYLPGQRGPATSPVAAAVPIAGLSFGTPDAGEPPVQAFHGEADSWAPIARPQQTCAAAGSAGLRCEVTAYAGEGRQLWSRRFDEVVASATDFLADEMLASRGYFALSPDAGGPYEVVEGATVALSGSGTGAGLAYSWAPGGRVDDPTSATPGLTGIDDGTETVTLTVTNSHGLADVAAAQVTTRNAAPTVGPLQLTTTPPARSVGLTAAVGDAGRADTHTGTIAWGDGTTTAATVDQGAGAATLTAQHTYAEPGRYTVTVTAADDDGGEVTRSATVVVGCTVAGTDRNDMLIGTAGADVVCGFGGHDLLVGFDGDDQLVGGTGNDILLGLEGDDVLVGGPGLDLALGGPGADTCTAELRDSCRGRS